MAGPGAYVIGRKLFDRTTGTVPVGGEEGNEVVGEECQGYEAADHGAAELEDGVDRHVEQLLSWMVSLR